MKKNNYYNPKNILKKGADYNLIIGQRSNGKTYGFCSIALTSHINEGARVAYVRRYSEDITKKNIENLFCPHPIEELTDNNYNGTIYRSNKFRLAKFENGATLYTEDIPFCQTFALNTWERVKGADNGYFDYIIFDEFITRGNYLPNEFVIFCNLLSSLLRDRVGTKIFMIANTVDKYCPYFEEMGLGDMFDNLKQGEIATKKFGDLKIAIELCSESGNTKAVSKYFNFNNPQLEMITTGKWEMKNYPHLTVSVKPENIIFRFYVLFDRKVFCGDVIIYNDDLVINFHNSKESEIKDDSIVYSYNEVRITPLHSNTLYDGTTRAHKIILDLVTRNKCFYTSNEVGELVRNWLRTQTAFKRNRLT